MPSSREHPSTYFVQDRANREELNRLQIQDRMLTEGMGGVLPEQSDSTAFPRVLDVGCGTGDWLIELAQTTPTCTTLVGVDISPPYVEYARTQATAAQVSDRVGFRVMDALKRLKFPDKSFDLVNQRFASSWLRTWEWRKVLREYRRVCRPGGVVRITEPEWIVVSPSPALRRLNQLSLQAFTNAGRSFTLAIDGITSRLGTLLHQEGFEQVQTQTYSLEYHAGTPEGQRFLENMKLIYRTGLAFLYKWVRMPDDYEALYRQMLDEMQRPDFVASWSLLTAWGTSSSLSSLPQEDQQG